VLKIFFFFSILMIIVISCSDSTDINKNTAVVQGTVYSIDENNQLIPLTNALISVQDYFAQTISNMMGDYELAIEFDHEGENISLTLVVSKAGYQSSSSEIMVRKGEIAIAPDITLWKLVTDSIPSDTASTSGNAAHIEIFGNHPQHLFVMGTGLTEAIKINFIVRDAQAIPVDESHRVKVFFTILEGANGGEYLEPDTMTTQNGLVYTILNSGIKAGPVKIQASTDINGTQIKTTPIRIAIYGGLPDAAHFSLASEIQNVAGLIYSGIIDRITAFVGDKYSNPVAPGTVVYFSSDFGITEGSAVTDEMGRATIQFMTADPRPPAPWDSSFAHITGWTFNDTQTRQAITSRTRVLLSGPTAPIQVSPTTFNYNNSNTPVSFDYEVSDIYGYPLVANSLIEVQATDGEVFGDTRVTMKDTQFSGPGLTQFRFTWAPGDSLEAPQVMINIKVNTPANGNGYQSTNILGTKTGAR
jgi:hypothetical protein